MAKQKKKSSTAGQTDVVVFGPFNPTDSNEAIELEGLSLENIAFTTEAQTVTEILIKGNIRALVNPNAAAVIVERDRK